MENREHIRDKAARLLKAHKNRKRWYKVLCVMASVVVFCTVYALILPALTLEKTQAAACGLEEHTHTEECYDENGDLVCTLPEHTHTEACYPAETSSEQSADVQTNGTLDSASGSGTAAAVQTAASTSTASGTDETVTSHGDLTADLETAADWEKTISGVKLTGVWADDVVAIAKSQLGYQESTANYIINEAGEQKGYSRYGVWYGDSYGDWCAMFVSWCLHYAGVEGVPLDANCESWISRLTDAGLYADASDTEPESGDIIFFNNHNTAKSDHVGLVEQASEDGQITTIEGNSGNTVRKVQYEESDSRIVGYGKLPENPALAESDDSREESAQDDVQEKTVQTEAADTVQAASLTAADDGIMALSEDGEADADTASDSDGSTKSDTAIDFTEYIDSVTVSKLENGNWKESDTFTDGDNVRVSISYTIPANLVTGENRQIYYQLPEGVHPNAEEIGTVYQGGTAVGTYSISTDGLIVITFNDEFANGEAFTGDIQFQGTVEKTGSGDSGKISFGGDSKDITIEKEKTKYDLSVKKTATQSKKNDGIKVSYTVTASTKNGTGSEVTMTDALKDCTAEVSYQEDTIKIYKIDADGGKTEVTGWTKTMDGDGKGFSITGLPTLEAGESYQLEYDVSVENLAADGSGTIVNSGAAKSGNNSKWDWHTETVAKPVIEKTGSYDKAKDIIDWKITINNTEQRDLTGYTVTDTPNDVEITGDVVIKDSNGNTIKTLTAKEFAKDGYTFLEGSTASAYYITYQTTTPKLEAGKSATVSNSASISDGDGKSWESKGEIGVTKRDWGVTKQFVKTETDTDGNTLYRWNTLVDVPESWTEITLTDTLTNAEDKTTGETKADTHYAIASELQSYIEKNLQLDLKDGTTLGYDSDKLDITVTYYDAEGNIVTATDTATHVTSFKIVVKPKDGETVAAYRMRLYGYPTRTDTGGMEAGDTWTIKNTAAIPDKSSTAKHEIQKPKALEKMTGEKENTYIVYSGGDTTVTYDETEGILYYQLLIRTDSSTTGDIVVTDTLPAGAVLVKNDTSSPAAYFWENANYQYQAINWWDSAGKHSYDLTSAGNFETSVGKTAEAGTTKVTFTIGNGYNNDGKTHTLAIRYAVSVADDSRWKDLSIEQLMYTNQAEWGTNSDSTTTEVDREVEKVKKAAAQVQATNADGKPQYKEEGGEKVPVYTNRVKYTVILNPAGEDLDPKGDTLTLTDTVTVPAGVGAYVDLSSLKLYEYATDDDGNQKLETEIDKSRYTVTYDQNTHQMTLKIPDSLACTLVYEYVVDAGDVASPKLSNSVQLSDEWADQVEYQVDTNNSSATVNRGKFIIYKVDSENYGKLLPGAKFMLYSYSASTNSWSEGTEAVTNEDGELTLTITDDTSGPDIETDSDGITLKQNVLYKLVETKAPEGYAASEEPMYLIWKGKTNGSELSDADAYQAAADSSGSLTIGEETLSKDKVKFYSGTSDGSLYYENEYSNIDVKKVWTDTDGKELKSHPDAVEVSLYRSEKQLKVKMCTVTVLARKKGETNSTKKGTYQVPADGTLTLKNKGGDAIDVLHDDGTSIGSMAGWGNTLVVDVNADMTIITESSGFVNTSYDVTPSQPADDDYETVKTLIKTVTLNSDNGWSYTWSDLPSKGEDDSPYYYTIEEVNTPSGYDVTYTNNDGITKGEIVVTNRKQADQGYELPESGGIGTHWYTFGGTLLLAAGLLMYKKISHRKRGRRV